MPGRNGTCGGARFQGHVMTLLTSPHPGPHPQHIPCSNIRLEQSQGSECLEHLATLSGQGKRQRHSTSLLELEEGRISGASCFIYFLLVCLCKGLRALPIMFKVMFYLASGCEKMEKQAGRGELHKYFPKAVFKHG